MARRKNFPNRIKARRQKALYNWEHIGERELPDDVKARENKIAWRKEQIEILKKRV